MIIVVYSICVGKANRFFINLSIMITNRFSILEVQNKLGTVFEPTEVYLVNIYKIGLLLALEDGVFRQIAQRGRSPILAYTTLSGQFTLSP